MPKTPAPARPSPPLAVAAVLLFSTHPERLAAFYRDLLGLPLRRFTLTGVPTHWACELSHVYVSVWPVEEREDVAVGRGRAGLALYVRDVRREFTRLKEAGVPVDFEPRATPLGLLARLRDPEDNPFELYQPLAR